MPYTYKKVGDKWCAYNKDTGKEHGCSDSEKMAKAHLRALYAAESRGKKSYDSYSIYQNQVSPQEADYDPLGGIGESHEACANCQFFSSPDGCLIVMGDISPTGKSKFWTEKIEWEQEPIPVYLVEEEKSVAGKIRDWFSKLLSGEASSPVVVSEKGLKPVYVTEDNDGSTRVWLVGSNNFEDRHGQIIPEDAHKEYVDWVNETGLYPEIAFWHLGEKSRWGQIDQVFRHGHFTVFTGPVDPGMEVFAKNCADDPSDVGVSNGYFAVLHAGNKEFALWRPFEISVLSLTDSANIWMGDEESLILEGFMALEANQKSFLEKKGASPEFITQLESFLEERGEKVENAGVGSKEVTPPPAPPDAPKPGELTIEAITGALAQTLSPLVERITALEEGQKSLQGKVEKSTEDLLADQLQAQIGIAAQQGYKASESQTNVVPNTTPENDLNWLGKELDKLMTSGGVRVS